MSRFYLHLPSCLESTDRSSILSGWLRSRFPLLPILYGMEEGRRKQAQNPTLDLNWNFLCLIEEFWISGAVSFLLLLGDRWNHLLRTLWFQLSSPNKNGRIMRLRTLPTIGSISYFLSVSSALIQCWKLVQPMSVHSFLYFYFIKNENKKKRKTRGTLEIWSNLQPFPHWEENTGKGWRSNLMSRFPSSFSNVLLLLMDLMVSRQ